jgi:hypothetical protein
MNRIAIAVLLALSCSSAFAVPANGSPNSPSANYPASKQRLDRGPGDYPRTKPYAHTDMLAGELHEHELACLATGSCKPQLRTR